MKDQIEIGLRELKASIKRMKELLEWRKLQKQEERSDVPPSFRFQDSLEADINIEEGVFWKSVFEIQDVLGKRDDEAAKKARERMAKLEEEMRELRRRG
jgi:DNA-binding transcriptional MerR regulator